MYYLLYKNVVVNCYVFLKQKTAYEMHISDWSSDVCSSDLDRVHHSCCCITIIIYQSHPHVLCVTYTPGIEMGAPLLTLNSRGMSPSGVANFRPVCCSMCLIAWMYSSSKPFGSCLSASKKSLQVSVVITNPTTWPIAQNTNTFSRHPATAVVEHRQARSEERRVGKGCVSTRRFGWSHGT